jgi:AraC-like DNA-binding protein
LALYLGFASHAHFSATFQRTFQVSPSAFRAAASTRVLRKVRKNAKA